MEKYESQEKKSFYIRFTFAVDFYVDLTDFALVLASARMMLMFFSFIRYVKSSTLQFLTESY